MSQNLAFLCIACYFKGTDFIRACKQAGNTVYVVTKEALRDQPWPHEAIDEMFYVDSEENSPEVFDNMAKGTAFLMRNRKIDRIVALDDFDVEKAAFLREQFRIPGMGQTTARYFRDKLAMRLKASEAGIRVPGFTALFNDADIRTFMATHPAPWLVKPRSEASAAGISKITSEEALWPHLEKLGDERHLFLMEEFKPGNVYHVDALSTDGKLRFCRASRYLNPPFDVMHGGGIFRSCTEQFGSADEMKLQKLTESVMAAFGMKFGASHTEFIRCEADGEFYFLETSSRVGGAHLAEMVEASSGLNLWAEWAKIEDAMARGLTYDPPAVTNYYSGIIVSLARQENPDASSFNEPEICWRLQKPYHIGMIVQSESQARILNLLDDYAHRIFRDFHASAPAPEKPTD